MDSILNQLIDEKNYEIIIVNDGSTDLSLAIAEEYRNRHSKIIKIINQKNTGLLKARRKGFAKAFGDYIISCDSDDMFLLTN